MPNEYKPLSIPPGIIAGPTPSSFPNRWYDGNLVRWVEGVLRPILGWEQYALSISIATSIRAAYSWTDNQGVIRTALLCEKNCYVLEADQLLDITPTAGIVGPEGDITVGGYGEGAYSYGTYGTSRPNTVHVPTASPWWSLDNWGQNLLFMTSYDGKLWQWAPNTPKALLVTQAPIANRGFVVTPERYVMLFGMGGNIRRFGWCDRGDLTNWAFDSVTNTAGYFDVEPSSYLNAAKNTRYGVLMFSNVQSYLIRYVGVPYIYSYEPIAGGSTPITAAALSEFNGEAVWFSGNSFWQYDGASIKPLPCSLIDYITQSIDPIYSKYRMASVNLKRTTEVWFMFPSQGMTENDKIIIWDYKNNWWSKANVGRSCGYGDSYAGYPVLCSTVAAFRHEKGYYYSGSTLPFAQTSNINAFGPGFLSTIGPLLSDSEVPSSCVFEGTSMDSMDNGPPPRTTGPLMSDANGKVDMRTTGRVVQIKVSSKAQGLAGWSWGNTQLIQANRGRR